MNCFCCTNSCFIFLGLQRVPQTYVCVCVCAWIFCGVQNSVVPLMMEMQESDGSSKRAVPCSGSNPFPNKRRLLTPAASEKV